MATKDKPNEAIVYNFPHSIDDVYKEFTSQAYLEERAQWVQTDEVTVTEEERTDKSYKVVLDRYVYRDYPKAFKGLFPEKQYMINKEYTERDGSGYTGNYVCDVQKAPVLVEAEYTITPKGDGCELRALHQVTVKIPLIGKKVEKYVIGETKTQYEDQLHYLDLKLAGKPNLLPRDTGTYPVPKP